MEIMNNTETVDPTIENLIKVSHEAKLYSYSPYSKYRVGAALLTAEGKIFTGCNVENASIGLTICAERTAIVKAISEGFKTFKAIAVSGDDANRFITPCGACRQFMIEFGFECEVYMTKPDYSYIKMLTKDLLPRSYDPSFLAN